MQATFVSTSAPALPLRSTLPEWTSAAIVRSVPFFCGVQITRELVVIRESVTVKKLIPTGKFTDQRLLFMVWSPVVPGAVMVASAKYCLTFKSRKLPTFVLFTSINVVEVREMPISLRTRLPLCATTPPEAVSVPSC